MSVWCRDCFRQLRNDKCLSNHMRSCDGKALSGSHKAVEKFGNLLNIQYACNSLTGQKHNMLDHGIETSLTKRICLLQNVSQHSNSEICEAVEDFIIGNVAYDDDDNNGNFDAKYLQKMVRLCTHNQYLKKRMKKKFAARTQDCVGSTPYI